MVFFRYRWILFLQKAAFFIKPKRVKFLNLPLLVMLKKTVFNRVKKRFSYIIQFKIVSFNLFSCEKRLGEKIQFLHKIYLEQKFEELRFTWHSGRHAPRITQERNLRSKIRWFTDFCNSHYVSQLAAFFIDARAKRSTVKSCLPINFVFLQIIKG